ncbi:unnamed protein product, partial [Mesorhabditis spiculigera]
MSGHHHKHGYRRRDERRRRVRRPSGGSMRSRERESSKRKKPSGTRWSSSDDVDTPIKPSTLAAIAAPFGGLGFMPVIKPSVAITGPLVQAIALPPPLDFKPDIKPDLPSRDVKPILQQSDVKPMLPPSLRMPAAIRTPPVALYSPDVLPPPPPCEQPPSPPAYKQLAPAQQSCSNHYNAGPPPSTIPLPCTVPPPQFAAPNCPPPAHLGIQQPPDALHGIPMPLPQMPPGISQALPARHGAPTPPPPDVQPGHSPVSPRPDGHIPGQRCPRAVIRCSRPTCPPILNVPAEKAWGLGSLADYVDQLQIGEGTYGQVYKAVHQKTGHVVALKRIRLENEKEGFPITALPAHYLVFEYVHHDLHGLLESGLVKWNGIQCGAVFKQLAMALEYAHNNNIMHRDVKCSNILLTDKGVLKLADLGLARYYKDQDRLYTNHVITLWYRPPELLYGEERYGPAVDVWSAGCILAELFIRRPLFPGQTEMAQIDLVLQLCGTPTRANWPEFFELVNYKVYTPRHDLPRILQHELSSVPRGPLELIDKMLALNPKDRPSCSDILRHKFLKDIDLDQVLPLDMPKNSCYELSMKQARRDKKAREQVLREQQQQHQHHDNGQSRPSSAASFPPSSSRSRPRSPPMSRAPSHHRSTRF